MTAPPPPKRDPPIVAEEITDDFDLVDEMEVVDITEDLTPEEIAALESGQVDEVVSMTRSIIPSVAGVDPDIDLRVDQLFDRAILAPQPLPALAPAELPEEKTEPRLTTPKPPPPVVEEDEDDAFYAQFERQKA